MNHTIISVVAVAIILFLAAFSGTATTVSYLTDTGQTGVQFSTNESFATNEQGDQITGPEEGNQENDRGGDQEDGQKDDGEDSANSEGDDGDDGEDSEDTEETEDSEDSESDEDDGDDSEASGKKE